LEAKQEIKLKQRTTIIALTATATKKVRADIIERLDLQNPKIFTKGFDRKNISIVVREISKREEKQAKVSEILEKTP
jgi:ATP-dependent DNA helicase RecQ